MRSMCVKVVSSGVRGSRRQHHLWSNHMHHTSASQSPGIQQVANEPLLYE